MVVNIIIIFVVKTQSNKDKYIDNNIIQFFLGSDNHDSTITFHENIVFYNIS